MDKLKQLLKNKKVIVSLELVCVLGLLITLGVVLHHRISRRVDSTRQAQSISALKDEKESAKKAGKVSGGKEDEGAVERDENGMLTEYASLYRSNNDMIGWLRIEDSRIDYPVMQTPYNEEYYMYLDFEKKKNQNGSLIMDTDSTVGIGALEENYMDGVRPSTNLIIHGHAMSDGSMFGDLPKYSEKAYGEKHSYICFDSLYEKRQYQVMAVFYSQVYRADEDTFKFYQFFQADSEDEFGDWYYNVKKMSIYDTGVKAEYGDEFITLTCCSYHTDEGRFVVVGKRVM